MSDHKTKTVQDPATLTVLQVCTCQIEQEPDALGDRLILGDFDPECPHQ
jgi:hypothetical protein